MAPLIALAVQTGLPMVAAALQNKLGDTDGRLAAECLNRIAARMRLTPDAIEGMIDKEPGTVIQAMREVEKGAPEMVQLYLAEVQAGAALAQGEEDEPLWMRAWRPAGMYMIGFLWLWNVVLLHVANAIWKIALPPVPFDNLIQLSGLYMGLYMGGHTVKDIAAKWIGGDR